MRRLIYSSLAIPPMSAEALENMLTWARMLNEACDVTGLLLYFSPEVTDHPSFLQLLEGEEEPVESTYARITRDTRHRDLKVISRRDVEERLFPGWSMGLDYVTRAQLAQALPGRADSPRDLVVMAELLEDPARAESLLLAHCG